MPSTDAQRENANSIRSTDGTGRFEGQVHDEAPVYLNGIQSVAEFMEGLARREFEANEAKEKHRTTLILTLCEVIKANAPEAHHLVIAKDSGGSISPRAHAATFYGERIENPFTPEQVDLSYSAHKLKSWYATAQAGVVESTGGEYVIRINLDDFAGLKPEGQSASEFIDEQRTKDNSFSEKLKNPAGGASLHSEIHFDNDGEVIGWKDYGCSGESYLSEEDPEETARLQVIANEYAPALRLSSRWHKSLDDDGEAAWTFIPDSRLSY